MAANPIADFFRKYHAVPVAVGPGVERVAYEAATDDALCGHANADCRAWDDAALPAHVRLDAEPVGRGPERAVEADEAVRGRRGGLHGGGVPGGLPAAPAGVARGVRPGRVRPQQHLTELAVAKTATGWVVRLFDGSRYRNRVYRLREEGVFPTREAAEARAEALRAADAAEHGVVQQYDVADLAAGPVYRKPTGEVVEKYGRRYLMLDCGHLASDGVPRTRKLCLQCKQNQLPGARP